MLRSLWNEVKGWLFLREGHLLKPLRRDKYSISPELSNGLDKLRETAQHYIDWCKTGDSAQLDAVKSALRTERIEYITVCRTGYFHDLETAVGQAFGLPSYDIPAMRQEWIKRHLDLYRRTEEFLKQLDVWHEDKRTKWHVFGGWPLRTAKSMKSLSGPHKRHFTAPQELLSLEVAFFEVTAVRKLQNFALQPSGMT